MSKVVCVLYDDPVDGYPKSYARGDIPKLGRYPGGQSLPTPKAIDFKPGALLGSVSGELGLRKFLESQGHKFIVTSDKDGPKSVFEKELVNAGSAMDKVLKCNVYLAKAEDYAPMNEAFRGRFGDEPPVRTTIAAAWIPGDSLVEIDVVAYI